MYIGLLPGDCLVLKYLEENSAATRDFILSLPGERLTYRYAEGKKRLLACLEEQVRGGSLTFSGIRGYGNYLSHHETWRMGEG